MPVGSMMPDELRGANVGAAGYMGREVGKESTCSEVAVRLVSGDIPIGVIREMGKPTPFAACMMMNAEQCEISWAAGGRCCWAGGSAACYTWGCTRPADGGGNKNNKKQRQRRVFEEHGAVQSCAGLL